jgi:hypothetical protein
MNDSQVSQSLGIQNFDLESEADPCYNIISVIGGKVMIKDIIRFIMKSEGVSAKEAIEIWEEELKVCDNDWEEALYNFGMELDYAL